MTDGVEGFLEVTG